MTVTIIESIGKTPLLDLKNMSVKCPATVLAKQESRNPMGSVKDRIAWAMIESGIKNGKINSDTTIVEATSGNTGLGLAFICAHKRLRLILTMPESMSIERRTLLKHLGAELVLSPAVNGMKGALEEAEKILQEQDNAHMIRQFENPANPDIHERTTGEEIWQDTNGKVDIFIAGVGTGGTFTGVMRALKRNNPNIKGIAVEPADSPVLSGGKPGPHKIQGIGAGFIPANLDTTLVDKVIKVQNEDAIATARQLASREGILCGISSGAAVWAALEIAGMEDNRGKNIVVILPDTGERYLSTDLIS